METLVVADTKMIEYHGSENIEKYVLTVMNMVSPASSQQQSHQVPGDVAMTHTDHWPCQHSSLVGPQQSSLDRLVPPLVGFSALLREPSPTAGWVGVRQEQLSLQCFHLPHGLRAVPFYFPPWGWKMWPPREMRPGDTVEAEASPKPTRGPLTILCVLRKPPCRRRYPQGALAQTP